MSAETWQMATDSVAGNHRLLAAAARAARGTSVVVAPFDDELLARAGVWVEGERVEVRRVRDEAMERCADEVTAVPYLGGAR